MSAAPKLSLVSIPTVNALGSIRSTLRRQESRTADQRKLALIGATISAIDQAQSIPVPLAVKTLELAQDYLTEMDDQDMSTLRAELNAVTTAERWSLN